jgi:hypothetical protein
MKKLLFAVVFTSFVFGPAWAENPIDFEDGNLKAAIEDALWVSDPTPADMLGLMTLTYVGDPDRGNQIESLSGLQYATNLQTLTLRWHLISDISPLSGLGNLRTLALEECPLSDISTLSGLKNLRSVSLHRDEVRDISALTSLTSLGELDLRINPLNQEAYDSCIPQICTNNPGIWIAYDSAGVRRVSIESSYGGRVTDPGEDVYFYQPNEKIWLMAEADPYFVFANWSGSYFTPANPAYVTVEGDWRLRANFVSILETIYVDKNAPLASQPADPNVRSSGANGTAERPFARIQQAIDVAANGAVIIVRPGVYRENINLLGKRIQLTGIDPDGPGPEGYPIIEGYNKSPVVSFVREEGSNCRLTGFVITAGRGEPGAAIRCSHSSPTIANCLIVGNRSTGRSTAAVHCADSNAVFVNCTIADNCAGEHGAGLVVVNSHVVLANSILSGNVPGQVVVDGSELSVTYCDIESGWLPPSGSGSAAPGNIDADPLFARRGSWVRASNPKENLSPGDSQAVWLGGDYHLKSQAGRWNAEGHTWVQDAVGSPCIDGGDPSSPVEAEPAPNGGIINMGAYGGTIEASKTYRKTTSP